MKFLLEFNVIILVGVFFVCFRIGVLMCGKEIYVYVLRIRLVFDGFVLNVILDMYVRCGRMEFVWN